MMNEFLWCGIMMFDAIGLCFILLVLLVFFCWLWKYYN